ncbi:hypothetical protein FB382_000123 [Nocardioides ginsengisegetis]|uniref:Methyltransferase domain-containing protein n=1 Tax=Nocardioides ginsengisegetis TaxID=661491 RepID=A0A7W3IW96_9ACTN|nr:hypothetical protein [Nocardioides ginsengisegetis]MBA8801832.1 hypothetical protein [Nocardioides ginsengisegetis]
MGATDKRRWSSDAEFRADWSDRHVLLARWVLPGDHVVDLGSGPRAFERQLPKDCMYTPVDVVERGPGSKVCDFNREPMPGVRGDFVLMSGVLEYIHDPAAFLASARKLGGRGALSYGTLEESPRLAERRRKGWLNDLRESDLIELLQSAGWSIVSRDTWNYQVLLKLS